jgi:hypothetical protein
MAAAAPVAAGSTPKTRKPKAKTISALVFVTALQRANSEKTAEQVAESLGMEIGSFNQRLYSARKTFREDAVLRTDFADLYPKNEKGQIEIEDGSISEELPHGRTVDYPAFLNLKDGREGGGGREKGASMRDAMRALMAGETKTVDSV